jgi:guanylate kinase
LQGRGTDTPEVIEQRLQKATYEMSFASQYDYIIVNEDLEKAIQETKTIVQAFLSR